MSEIDYIPPPPSPSLSLSLSLSLPLSPSLCLHLSLPPLSPPLSPSQHLIQEVSDKREQCQAQIDDSFEISFKFDSLVKLMSSKQEQLFQGVVHFHTAEITRIGAGLDQAERKLAESPLIKGYVERQRHLHKLKVTWKFSKLLLS